MGSRHARRSRDRFRSHRHAGRGASDTLGPPPLDDVWEFKIARARTGGRRRQERPARSSAFDTTELQRRLDEKSAEAEEARKQIEKERADLKLQTKGERMQLAEAEARLGKAALKLEAPPDVQAVTARQTVEIEHAIAKREATAIRSRARSARTRRASQHRVCLRANKLRPRRRRRARSARFR